MPTARSLGLDAAHGVTVRLTGSVPLADEEFATLAQDAHLLLGAMFAALLGILGLAVRSARVVIAILATTIVGLIMTAAIGLLAIGRFNLISVAFIPLFVGLGVDFSIQFSVRSLAERLIHPNLRAALIATGTAIGRALALSAAAIGAGFFAFLPTNYVGVAELGTIAGLGMIVAFTLSIVLLPALLMLLRPPAGRLAEVGFTMLAPVDALVRRHRRLVLAGALVVAVGSCALLPLVRFDFDPLNLKSSKVESMATLQALASDPDWTPDAINILSPSLAASEPLVRRLDALPAVSRTVTLNSFRSGATEGETGADRQCRGAPQARSRCRPARAAVGSRCCSRAWLRRPLRCVGRRPTQRIPLPVSARRLADVLERLHAAAPDIRAAAALAVVTPLRIMLDQTRALLQAGPVTVETLPPELVADWIAKDGRARIQVLPRGSAEDNAALRHFADAILALAPDATGRPISISASGDTVVEAFLQAGLYSLLAIILLLAVVLRRMRDVILTMLPVLLSGLLTFATCAALDLPLNFTNIIALAPPVRCWRRLQHLLRAGVAGGRDRHAAVEPDARRRLQCADDRHGVRRPVAVEPSRHGQHGQVADDLPGLGASRHLAVPARLAGAAAGKIASGTSGLRPSGRAGTMAAREKAVGGRSCRTN